VYVLLTCPSSIKHPSHHDDEVTFNTQCSTQWDGFRHVPYQNYPEGQTTYFGGLTHEEAGNADDHRYGTQSESTRPCGDDPFGRGSLVF
jgi:hypothetical protein